MFYLKNIFFKSFIFYYLFYSFSTQAAQVPKKLFGIILGENYKADNSDVPVKKFTGCQKSFGLGIHCYFEPIDGTASQIFPYIEIKENPDYKFYKTSFHIYILPIIPNNIDSIDKLESLEEKDFKIEVMSIDWSEFPKEEDKKAKQKIEEDCYYWAIDLCKTFETYFSSKPKIFDYYSSKTYGCTFSSHEREFKVTGMGFKQVKLSYNEKVLDRKIKNVETILRKLEAKEILP